MKKILLLATLAILAACNSNEPAASNDNMNSGDQSTAPEITSPYAINYSSKFVTGDPANAESVLKLWKIWDGGDLSASKDYFADSMTLHLSSGSMISGTRDSVIANAQTYRSSLTSSVSSVDAVMAVKSTDKGENWALIWGKEINTHKDGSVDSSYLQETWRFNKEGKTDLMYQFRAAAAPPKN